MEINVSTRPAKANDKSCHVITLFSDGRLKGAARAIDKANEGLFKRLYQLRDFSGNLEESLMLHNVMGTNAARVLLVGLGDRKRFDADSWRRVCQAMAKALLQSSAVEANGSVLSEAAVEGLDQGLMAEQLARVIVAETYQFTLHTRQKPLPHSTLERLILVTDKKNNDAVRVGVDRGAATGRGIAYARDLSNLAPNLCTPLYLCNAAEELAEQHEKVITTILDEAEMESLGMGALLAVSRGSRQPGHLVIMNYQGRKRAGAPVVLVGKGITFDTGGISIKHAEAMDEMKYDMCGAASVFGVMQAVAELDLDINLIGVVAAAENMPDGDATRPGDVVTSMSGQSIEILNTDAEGRLVLCDALTYVEKFKPATVIDIATLTGACIIALGHVASAVLGNQQTTIDALVEAGQQSGDLTWSLPLWDGYQKQLDSNFADMANIGGRPAGAITAACFLSRFATMYDWAHLDVAGVAWQSGKDKGATGRPVALLMQFLFNRIER